LVFRLLEPLSDGLEERIMPAGDDGCEAEGAADLGAAAPDMAPAATQTRIAGVRSKPRKAGDRPVVPLARFGQAGAQDGRERGAEGTLARRRRRRSCQRSGLPRRSDAPARP
jgi:hypothetical protein